MKYKGSDNADFMITTHQINTCQNAGTRKLKF